MRIMGIDYGDARIGIAISDPFGWTAQGIETIEKKGGLNEVLDRIIKLSKDYSVERIIVGFPRNMNGSIGPRGEKTDEFIKKLGNRTDLLIVKWDERLTSVAASRHMNETGMKSSRKKSVIDQIAAVYILQGYLGSIKNGIN
jgi:putative Holliday junction resolvase